MITGKFKGLVDDCKAPKSKLENKPGKFCGFEYSDVDTFPGECRGCIRACWAASYNENLNMLQDGKKARRGIMQLAVTGTFGGKDEDLNMMGERGEK